MVHIGFVKITVSIIGIFILLFPLVSYETGKGNLPMIAIWRDFDGRTFTPSLRVAIWEDGKIVFSTNAPHWNRQLFQATVERETILRLKKEVFFTGVFQLTNNSVMSPGEPCYFLLVNFDNSKQILYYDERGIKNYWRTKDRYVKPLDAFTKCWMDINWSALSVIPEPHTKSDYSFDKIPVPWYIFPPGLRTNAVAIPKSP